MFVFNKEGTQLLIQIMGVTIFGIGMFLSIVIWHWGCHVFDSVKSKSSFQHLEVLRKRRRDLERHEYSKD